ncbi:MAG: hypothetical protein OEY63_05070 [Gemmatimonadota bacterium]|nr:hypothetical protein [Gemmatimonadota bacterium]MDH5803966.1 hypothetical protein [Gemmatimonadota bacterium]
MEGPNPEAVGSVAAEHLGPLLYALEVCATQMDHAERTEDAAYYRSLARLLAQAGGTPRQGQAEGSLQPED